VTSVPDAVEALSAQIREDLVGVDARIQAEQEHLLEAWPSLAAAARRRALVSFQRRVLALATSAGEIARSQVAGVMRSAYRLGAGQTATVAGAGPVFGGTDVDAIAVLASSTYADILEATRYVSTSTKQLVRTLTRERIADKLVTGQTPAQAAARLRKDLEGRGIAAIVYKDGAQHQLGDYTQMLIRTKSAEAAQLGGFAQARTLEIEYLELMDGPGCGLSSHKDPRKANGLILPLDEAARYPTSHPNCRRTSSPRPDITAENHAQAHPLGPQYTAEDIARAEADSSVDTAAESPAAARARARVAKRTASGTLVAERGVSAAEQRNAARLRKRATRPAGRG
jgi:hypothetical protein